jgi:hypothetical protein
MRRDAEMYLVVWGKPVTRSVPGRFYREMKTEFGGQVRFIQRSVCWARTFEIAQRLTESAKRYGLKTAIFWTAEIVA